MSDLDRKFIITAELRELEKQVDQEDITYSRMVELLNEKASNYAKQQVIKGKIEVLEDVFDHSFDPYVKHKLDELKQLEKL